MPKYTVDYVKSNKVAIKVNSEEEVDKLKEMDCVGFILTDPDFPYYTCPCNKTWGNSDTKDWNRKEDWEFIDYKTFIQDNMKEQFPKDDFGIIVENNNGKEIVDYLVSKGFINVYNFRGKVINGEYYCIEKVNKDFITTYCNNPTSKTYTLLQLKQLDNMEKKIIGYKLIKPEYENAVNDISRTITGNTTWTALKNSRGYFGTEENPDTIKTLEKAGVLNLWFEPVYSQIEQNIVLSNNKSVKIKSEGIEIENRLIKIKYIENLFCNKNTFGDTSWTIQYNSFDIGCYKNLIREDLNKILECHKKIVKNY